MNEHEEERERFAPRNTERFAAEAPTERIAPAQPTERLAAETPTERSAAEAPTERLAPEQPATDAASQRATSPIVRGGGAQILPGAPAPESSPRRMPLQAPAPQPTGAGAPGQPLTPSTQPGMAPTQPGMAPAQPGTPPAMVGGAPAQPLTPPARRRRGPGWIALISVGLIASLLGGTIGVGVMSVRWGEGRPAAAPTSTTSGVTQTVANTSGTDWQAVAGAVGNAVVAIDVQTAAGGSSGSGFIIDAEGRIITNDHVVSGANSLFVTLSDGRVYEAELVGSDEATDLAVIKLVSPPEGLTVARFGDSSAVKVGQPVAAIGNPLGLSSTMTTGIISALDRPVQTVKQGRSPASSTRVVTNAIQIDAAVNPGNSGGPVFDATGAVIGVASSIASLGENTMGQVGSIGLGFAIPAQLAQRIADEIISKGVAEHAFLGVSIVDGVGQADGTAWKGAKIGKVEAGTPADGAKLRVGDVILKVNGRDVTSALALTGYVRQFATGDVVTLLLVRNGELINVDVVLATRPD
ncbi:trypsin-like peptidase domain-containing protein [Trueperella pecoris]|uniref:Trypsin-like peptidase domain-containing protein n=1 Tax=Trueperella pecoris TaxID=2733571 RepID=A0A7M1R3V3_9ACTO|nr:trypsin-like peptidase domain-containing protein [Trueperella pecoris]QOR48145.1 trypsin-like peptidase domain-containing protein [Trueperella pecoris]